MKITSNLEKTKKRAITKFNKFICFRDLRESNGEIFGFCISCGKIWRAVLYSDKSIMNGQEWHAGHYFGANEYESVRFNEWNVNGQHHHCNRYLHGDKINYKERLIKKISGENFKKLEFQKNQPKKFTIIECENIIEIYSEKIKIEALRLGIKHY